MDVVALTLAETILKVTSDPSGATVLIDGEWGGTTPLEAPVEPARELRVVGSMAGFASDQRRVVIEAGAETSMHLSLEAEFGEIELAVEPTDAVVWIDGVVWGPATGTMRLPARPQNVEIRKPSFMTYRTTVVPTPDYEQALSITLESREEIVAARTPQQITTHQGQEMVLVSPAPVHDGSVPA